MRGNRIPDVGPKLDYCENHTKRQADRKLSTATIENYPFILLELDIKKILIMVPV